MGDTLPEVEARQLARHGAMRRHWSTVSADTLAEIEAGTLGNTWGTAQPPVNFVRASREEVESETQGDILGDVTHWLRRCLKR